MTHPNWLVEEYNQAVSEHSLASCKHFWGETCPQPAVIQNDRVGTHVCENCEYWQKCSLYTYNKGMAYDLEERKCKHVEWAEGLL